jgi:hypothetical protein
VWGVGVLSLVLNLVALIKLDFLNVMLLLPSLLFSVSTLVGPFLMHPKAGPKNPASWAPKLLGWLAGGAFFTLVAALMAQRGVWEWIGLLLLVAGFGLVLRHGLSYFGFTRRIQRLTRQLGKQLAAAGLAADAARTMSQQIVPGLAGDWAKVQAALRRAAVADEHHESIRIFVQQTVVPWLKRPQADLQSDGWTGQRLVSEFCRSLALSLFTLLWFFLVPIPGLLVFTAGDYRTSISLAGLAFGVLGTVGVAVLGLGTARLIERVSWRGIGGLGLRRRIERNFQKFQSLLSEAGRLTTAETASLHALFTDVQTYVDQCSYAYARQSLERIERLLTRQRER